MAAQVASASAVAWVEVAALAAPADRIGAAPHTAVVRQAAMRAMVAVGASADLVLAEAVAAMAALVAAAQV